MRTLRALIVLIVIGTIALVLVGCSEERSADSAATAEQLYGQGLVYLENSMGDVNLEEPPWEWDVDTEEAYGYFDDPAYVAQYTEGFESLQTRIREYTPEAMAPVCGIDAGMIRTVARRYASSKASIIFWGMGVSQHVHGTDNSRCLISLATARRLFVLKATMTGAPVAWWIDQPVA